MSCKFEIIQKEFIHIESHKSYTEHPIVNDFVVINIPEEDVEPKQIILDLDDQPISVAFADGSDSNNDNSGFRKKLKAMNSQIISLKEELEDMRSKYYDLRDNYASKNHMNDDTPICERHEENYIQSKELSNDVRNDLEDFKRCVRSMRIVHWKLFTRDDGKTTGVLPNKESKIVNQEPQSKTDLAKSITKFLDG
uniref:Uncharacterized protein n=1 Tax=Tanacetum cinerariifolium TaxID=118510 RepID=A0A6L2JWH2_TANCI|nr:hypothetical protein [Tanacetum cinerariifolium]